MLSRATSSSCWTSATSANHLPFKSSFIHWNILKSFLEQCDSLSCSFSQKETTFHTHSLFFEISHFNLQTIAKYTCKLLKKMPQKMTRSMQDNVTWHTSSECCNHLVPSGRTMIYASFAQKIQILEIFGSHLLLVYVFSIHSLREISYKTVHETALLMYYTFPANNSVTSEIQPHTDSKLHKQILVYKTTGKRD